MYDLSPVHLSDPEIVTDPTEKGCRAGECVSRQKTKHNGNEARRFRSCPKGKAMDAGSNWRQEMFLNRKKKQKKSLEMEKRTKEFKHLYCWPERILTSTLHLTEDLPSFFIQSPMRPQSLFKHNWWLMLLIIPPSILGAVLFFLEDQRTRWQPPSYRLDTSHFSIPCKSHIQEEEMWDIVLLK